VTGGLLCRRSRSSSPPVRGRAERSASPADHGRSRSRARNERLLSVGARVEGARRPPW
jgi:hypothetical protein